MLPNDICPTTVSKTAGGNQSKAVGGKSLAVSSKGKGCKPDVYRDQNREYIIMGYKTFPRVLYINMIESYKIPHRYTP